MAYLRRKTGEMAKLSQLAETLIGSEIVKLGNEINERIRQGEKIYNYTIGDFDPKVFPIPALLEDLIVEAYRNHFTNYPPADGVLDLRQAVGQFLKEWEGLDYAPNEIQIASGGRPLIYAIFKVLVDKGDKVIYASPSWNNNHYVHLNDGVHCMIEASVDNHFMPTAEEIKPYINGATLLCLCTPQNPTGTVLQKETLVEICDMVLQENQRRGADEKKLYVMFDQMYWTLTFGDTAHYNPVTLNPAMREYTIFVDGISKAFAATGVRVGWSMGPAPVIAKMKAILSHLGAWAPMAEQKAVAKYLVQQEAVATHLVGFKAAIENRLNRIYKGFKSLNEQGFSVDAVTPQAAIYLTIQLNLCGKITPSGKTLDTQADVTQYMLDEAKLAVVPFYCFGASKQSSWYRLSVGVVKEEDIDVMLDGVTRAVKALK
jgi:aspartate aminotransferase